MLLHGKGELKVADGIKMLICQPKIRRVTWIIWVILDCQGSD